MSNHSSGRQRSRLLRTIVIFLPAIIILVMLLLVLLDNGPDVSQSFNYRLY